ncbi:MAG: choice-of-anchor L domain-containing protein [Bacteroidales bacterium]
MKTLLPIPAAIFIAFLLYSTTINSQISIVSIPEVSPEEMVEHLIGPGVYFDNVYYQGAGIASGIFSNGSSTNIGIETGVFLTSGSGAIIPGPNSSSSASVSNGLGGHPLLNNITTAPTYDASVLEFDFVPLNDTVKCNFVFGSEEYNEYVGSTFNDVFGFFVTGPNPNGGMYTNKNIALVPDTDTFIAINNVNNGYANPGVVPTGPCTHCEYFVDNTGGVSIQYDAFTTVITLWVLVTPDETYSFSIAIGDAGDHIFDSGVLLEGASFKSLGPPEFLAFGFLMENNPELNFDINGQLIGNEVFLEMPAGTDLTNLVASFEVRGVEVLVEDILQQTGTTANDFTEPLIYHLEGYAENDWVVHAYIVADVTQHKLNSVIVGPNPAVGKICIDQVQGINVNIYNLLGNKIYEQTSAKNNNPVTVDNLLQGIYFVELSKDGYSEIRKVVVN